MSDNVVALAPAGLKPKNADAKLDLEMGITSPIPGGSYFDFYGITSDGEIPRTALVSLDDLVLMRRKDGQARALYRLLTLPIRAALRTAEWVAPEEGDADKETEFANAMFRTPPQAGGMTTPMSKVLRNTLLALPDGFSVLEEVRHVPDDGPMKGMITLRKLAYRDSRTVRFIVDENGGFAGIRQVTNLAGRHIDVRIPHDKIWYYAHQEEENPFYGVSAFEPAYQHFDIKRKLYYIAHLAAQFAAVPGRTGEVPANYDRRELAAFKQALANFAFNTAMTYPAGYKVDFKTNNSSFDYLKLIDHHNHMMSQSVLAGFMDSENRPALVDIQKSDPSADFFVSSLETIMDEIAESWTIHLMPKYIDWNFGTQKYPVFKFGALTDQDKGAIQAAFTAVVGASTLNCTPEFVREVEKKLAQELGLDIDYEDIEKKEQEEALAQAEAAAAAATAPAPPEENPPAEGEEGNGPTPPSQPTGPQPVAASALHADLDDLITMGEALLKRHQQEDF